MNRLAVASVIVVVAVVALLLVAPSCEKLPPPMRVAFITLATRRPYFDMATAWAESLDKHFCPGKRTSIQPSFIIFTDQDGPRPNVSDVTLVPTERLAWPETTLIRFQVILDAWNETLDTFDFLFWMDSDTIAVADFCEDILGQRVALWHLWYPIGSTIPFEDNYQSAAFVPRADAEMHPYYSAHLYGGSRDNFENLLHACAATVARDIANGIVAKVHDETHINKFFTFFPPTLILTHSYTCFPPEAYDHPGLVPEHIRVFSQRFKCIIKALWKENEIREV